MLEGFDLDNVVEKLDAVDAEYTAAIWSLEEKFGAVLTE